MKFFLDYHSTTPVDPRVEEVMRPFYSDCFYNPSSTHIGGVEAGKAVERAREQVANLIGAKSDNIYFTTSATEANNLITQGLFNKSNKLRIITSSIEHSSMRKSIENILEYIKTYELPIDEGGFINIDILNDILILFKYSKKEFQTLVSIIHGNNEIGVIQDLKRIGEVCLKYNVLFHSDITQSVGKIPINVDEYNLFAASFSSHKIYGPKGVGALFIRDASKVKPLLHGGFQNTISSGTLNVPAIVGFGKACEILKQEGPQENKKVEELRNYLLNRLLNNIPDIYINGSLENRLPNNLNISIKDVSSDIIIDGIDDIMLSSGSACISGKPSHVLEALNLPYKECAIRFGLGRFTTKEDIDYTVKRITEVVKSVRS